MKTQLPENASSPNEVESEIGHSFSFVEAELSILEFWNKNKIFQKSLDKTKSQVPYIFYDGPPFATGLPHHGHLVASTLKDIVPRYFTMKGRYVERRFGWDCHGLPIEQEIDKKYGMSAMDYVAKNGIKSYNNECRGIVQKYVAEWEKTISRLGRWVDFKNDYKTMDLSFMESVWWVLKQAWDQGLLYQGQKVVPFSTALGTGLANFEATQNYMSVQDPAITVLFKIDQEDSYIAAWTTTPWTLPSNLGLCVNENLDYVLVHDKDLDKKIIFASERAEVYSKKRNFETLKNLKGKELVGKRYNPLFPFFEHLKSQGAFTIFADDYVTTSDGTGIVHLAPAFGEDDNRVFKQQGLISSTKNVFVCPVDDAGKFTDEVSSFKGQYVKDADKEIIKYLKNEKSLYEQSTIVHNYPFCYRTDTPLIYKSMPQWYLAVEKIKSQLMAANSNINWVPDHIKEGRFGKWLEGARDWAISRNRYWGTPLPIWINDITKKTICIGSVAELEKLTGEKVHDIHRDSIDHLTFHLEGEKGVYHRINDVLDCWFESGSMPYAQLHYPFENQSLFKAGFPAEFIAEGLDQTRGWFYTLTVLSTVLFKKPAFKNVIVNGMVLAADGKKMSKRLKNYTAPDILMEQFGADALRLYMINSGIVRGEELRFTDDGVKDMIRRTLLPWHNAFKFFLTYSVVDGWNPKDHLQIGNNITDRWLLSKMQTLIKNVNHEMEQYRLYNVVPALLNFIEDLTNWYIRLNRRRFWDDGLTNDKREAYSALFFALKNLSAIMAPFAPFHADYIYLELQKISQGHLKEESIHLCDFPQPDSQFINPVLEDAVDRMQQVILLGRQKRNLINVKVKIPLRRLTIVHSDQKILDEIKKLEVYIQNELNVKKIEYDQNEEQYIKLYAKPNSPVLGPRLGKDFGKFRESLSNLSRAQLITVENGGQLEINQITFFATDFLIFREPKAGTKTLSNRLISIELDETLDPDLVNEGLAREVVNRIQKSRKELNFHVSDRISIRYFAVDSLAQAIEQHRSYISKETLAHELIKSACSLNESEKPLSFEIEGHQLDLAISLNKR